MAVIGTIHLMTLKWHISICQLSNGFTSGSINVKFNSFFLFGRPFDVKFWAVETFTFLQSFHSSTFAYTFLPFFLSVAAFSTFTKCFIRFQTYNQRTPTNTFAFPAQCFWCFFGIFILIFLDHDITILCRFAKCNHRLIIVLVL